MFCLTYHLNCSDYFSDQNISRTRRTGKGSIFWNLKSWLCHMGFCILYLGQHTFFFNSAHSHFRWSIYWGFIFLHIIGGKLEDRWYLIPLLTDRVIIETSVLVLIGSFLLPPLPTHPHEPLLYVMAHNSLVPVTFFMFLLLLLLEQIWGRNLLLTPLLIFPNYFLNVMFFEIQFRLIPTPDFRDFKISELFCQG